MASPDAAENAPAPDGFGVRGVHYSYGVHTALTNVNLSVAPGEIHALVGRHNEGKSTLCAVMTGRLAPDSGRVFAQGRAFAALTPGKAREMGVFAISANPRIYPRLTVLENLVSGNRSRWRGFFPTRRNRRLIQAWLEENGIDLPLGSSMHEVPRDLWVVVEVLSKLYQNPRLLVMDEAIEELDRPWSARVHRLIGRHLAGGMGLLLVTHKIEDALHIADRVSVMRKGSVILTASAPDMERLNLIRLCYAQLDGHDEYFSSRETFQELMRYTEAMLRDLPTAIVILDPGLNIRFVNENGRKILARHGADVSGTLFGPDNRRLLELVRRASETGEDANHHTVPVSAGERKIIADIRIQAVRENKVKVGTMVIIEDVSLREELRRRLVLSEQLASIGLLAAGVAHEINNPLEILGNYLTYLRDDATTPETLEVISRMDEEIVRIHEITNNLVAHTGSAQQSEKAVDVMALVREIAALLRFHGSFAAIDFHCAESGGRALVRANPSELRQVFLNLIRNSIDAMPEGGRISITSETRPDGGDGKVIVRVADTGSGIDFDNPNDIFLPFVTTKKNGGKKTGGQKNGGNANGGAHQGLGLYIVYGIIEKCRGAIAVETPPSGGCEFRLTFPLAGPV